MPRTLVSLRTTRKRKCASRVQRKCFHLAHPMVSSLAVSAPYLSPNDIDRWFLLGRKTMGFWSRATRNRVQVLVSPSRNNSSSDDWLIIGFDKSTMVPLLSLSKVTTYTSTRIRPVRYTSARVVIVCITRVLSFSMTCLVPSFSSSSLSYVLIQIYSQMTGKGKTREAFDCTCATCVRHTIKRCISVSSVSNHQWQGIGSASIDFHHLKNSIKYHVSLFYQRCFSLPRNFEVDERDSRSSPIYSLASFSTNAAGHWIRSSTSRGESKFGMT